MKKRVNVGKLVLPVLLCLLSVGVQAAAPINGILREVYAGSGGAVIGDLTNSVNYPNNPTSQDVITDFFEAPTDIDENYGQRLRALINAPATGNYTFWIASDDASSLYLSTDDTPAKIRLIANVNGWTPPRNWGIESNQQSEPISLVSGKAYYIEALMVEGTGGDNLAVRWQLPNGTMEEPIPASRLLVYGLGPPLITQQPANTTAPEGGAALFAIQVSSAAGMTYQWQRNGTSILEATNSSYLLPVVALADSGSRFRCLLANAQGSTNSTEAILTVTADTTPPTVVSVGNLGDTRAITLVFSEPVEESTALQAGNYAINNGITVTSASFAGDTRTVALKTSNLTAGTAYVLTVNRVRDRATDPNPIVANTQRSFVIGLTPLDVSYITGLSEPLGPSNRRGGLTISEIMYHPASRTDGKNLQYVELFNSHDWPEKLDGYRLSGTIDYAFPSNTTLAARSFLVVAPAPADIKAVYGINNVIGGFTDNLANGSGNVRLRNRIGAVLADAHYSGKPPYAIAADGAGHSLVLARPSYGEGEAKAWAASDRVGGSPGVGETTAANPYRTILINEFLAHTDDPDLDYIELYNYGQQAVNLSGCILTDDPTTNKFVIPNGTVIPGLGFVVFNQNQMGFALDSSGESVFLFAADRSRVVDAVRFGPQANGVATGRYPDGAPSVHELAAQTPGSANSPLLVRDIVINEIMYHPISGDNGDEYIELYNQGVAAVDLSGWRFVDGIDFTIPPGRSIAAGGYLVVAKNAARLVTRYANLDTLNTIGDYQGTLGNGGEHIALAMPHPVLTTNVNGTTTTNWMHVVVDEVTPGTGGRWGQWADGGGSSLELTDPHSDHRLASNWADSDDTSKSGWTTVQYSGLLDNGNGAMDELQILLEGAGECLVDDVQVLNASGVSLIANSTFEGGLTGWVPQGNHSQSTVEETGYNSSYSLHVRAIGQGDAGANRVRVPLTSALSAGSTATIRAKVRWLCGSPQVLFRLHGNFLEAIGTMTLPANPGTPGARNSRAVANAGPAIFNVSHSPVLPVANQAITVTAQAYDPDGLASMILQYRVDPATNTTSVAMNYNGAGFYSATIPGRVANALVAFHIQATDGAAASATTLFPNNAPVRECLVRFGEPQPAGNLGAYHLWITKATYDRWSNRLKLDNGDLDGTFVYGKQRVVYNMGAAYGGSPWIRPSYNTPTGGLCGYSLHFPPDDLLLGVTDFALDYPARDGSAQLEQISFWIADQLNIPTIYRRYINLFVSGVQRGTIYEDCLRPNSEYIHQYFPDDTDGDLYKIDDWFEFNDAAAMEFNIDATLQNFTTTGGAKKLARYRWNWRQRTTKGAADDYTRLFALVDAVNTADANAYTLQVESLVDVNEWMRAFAVEHIAGNWDSYGYGRGKNMYTYKPVNGKWNMLMWDIDFVLGAGGDGATANLFSTIEPVISRMYNHPPFRRAYFRALYDAANGPLLATTVGPVMDARYAALLANGISVSGPQAGKEYIAQRRTYILQQLNSVATNFAVTSGGGQNFSTNKTLIALTGTAPVGIKTIEVNGVAYPITWSTVNSWSMAVPLTAGANVLAVTSYDSYGNPFAGATASLTVTCTAAADLPQDRLVINEIMYHPVTPDTSYIEIYNRSTTTTFDLSNYRLDGAGFVFPEGTIIGPNSYVVAVKDRIAFGAAYGATIPTAGEYSGQLANGGETLRLVKPGTTPDLDLVVDWVRYDNASPWPANADGFGPSLQLMDATQDNSRVGNWAASATNATVRFTPGSANSVRTALAAFPTVWINEVLPQNVNGLADRFGHRAGWIELYNSGTAAVDLGGLYLANNLTNLAQWQFPASTLFGAGQSMIVWADAHPEETGAGEWHANFTLTPGTGAVALSRQQNGAPAAIGFLNYKLLSPERSYGSYPDGQDRARQVFHYVTPGTANNPASMPVAVFINEWMASNTSTLSDPANGRYEDWFELYNAGSSPVDLTGYNLTDDLTNTTKFMIPAGKIIGPQGYLLVWADEDAGANSATNPVLHVNFKLSAGGETIGLFAPDKTLVSSVLFGIQTNDVSQGRFPDGSATIVFLDEATPGTANATGTNNRPPVILPIPDQTVIEGQTLQLTVTATDQSGQTLTYSLGPGAPSGMVLNAASGLLTWTPASAQVPSTNIVTVLATDNGQPPLSDGKTVRIVVLKLNHAPVLNVIANQAVNEGQTLAFAASATDPDAGQTPSYTLGAGAPAGVVIQPASGLLTWTPVEAQGPGTYSITVQVADNGVPVLTDSKSFTVTVNEVNTAPVLGAITVQSVNLGQTLQVPASATDTDLPAQTLSYSLEGAPAGMSINAASGVITWTPTAAQVPSTNQVTVHVSDNGSPSLSAAQTMAVIASPAPQWQYVAVTGTASSSTFYIYLTTPGDLYVDDVMLVAGDAAGVGPNVLPNGDFEGALTGPWTVSANHAGSVIVTNLSHSGKGNLHVVAGSAGSTRASSIWQDISPALTSGGVYTLSYWYRPGSENTTLIMRLSGFGINSSNYVAAPTNQAPVLAAIGNQSINEGSPLTFTATASDGDVPAQALTFSLGTGAPSGASITAGGVFSWTPTEAQGPGNYNITVRVSDNGTPSMSASRTFTVTVNEANRAPVLAAISDQSVKAGQPVSFTATASDPDLPTQTLTYSLEAGAPTEAGITPAGVFAWTPTPAQAPSTNTVSIRVSDNGTPSLSDTRSFKIMVVKPSDVRITQIERTADGVLRMQWTTEIGGVYRVMLKREVTDASWLTLKELTATGPTSGMTNNMSGLGQCFLVIERIP